MTFKNFNKKEFFNYWNSKKEYIEKDLWVIRNFLLPEEVKYLQMRASEEEGWYTTMRSPYGNIRNKWIDQVPEYDDNGNIIMPAPNSKSNIEVPYFNGDDGIFMRLHAVLPKTYKEHNTLQSFFGVSDEEISKINSYIDPSWPAMGWHHDGQDGEFTKMTGAFTIYINDDFDGGILEFKNKPYKIKPEPGMLVNVPIYEEFTHRVTRVTNGNRHTLYGNCWEEPLKAPQSTMENC